MKCFHFPALLLLATLIFPLFCVGQASGPGGCFPQSPTPALPLHTDGRWIVDRNGQRVTLQGVNWYGAEEKDYVPAGLEAQSLDSIAARIRCMGFNSVRLLWSNQLYESNPIVGDKVVAANPQLRGKHAMDVFDAVIAALARHGLMIILDNHVSRADWCCKDTDGNAIWYNAKYPESSWIADWKAMASRYKNQPLVIGADLRNELRGHVTWGGAASTDWHAASERGGDAVLSANPNLLIFIEGVNYALNLTGIARLPAKLSVPHRLVYEAHNYPWDQKFSTYAELARILHKQWGYILTPGQSYTAPVWVGEFGTCHTSVACFKSSSSGTNGFWFVNFLRYLKRNQLGWSYWALNGTEATGYSRTYGAEETFGLLNMSWDGPAMPRNASSSPVTLLKVLQTIM